MFKNVQEREVWLRAVVACVSKEESAYHTINKADDILKAFRVRNEALNAVEPKGPYRSE